MEFIQFHPTALYDQQTSPAFLISEAVRGQGAYLRNAAGERFMFKYHVDGELACRDAVSRAIASEILAGKEKFVYLDCTHVNAGTLLSHFPNIYRNCLSRGIDITRDYIPVAPAAHYLCGGIDVDLRSRTTLDRLYACGECSNTGLHGANRLASNSLLEATVFAHNCFEDIVKTIEHIPFKGAVQEPAGWMRRPEVAGLAEIKRSVQFLMTIFAGIVRSTKGMENALNELEELEGRMKVHEHGFTVSPEWYEVRNMIICAKLILAQSLERKDNRGGFYNKNLAFDEVTG